MSNEWQGIHFDLPADEPSIELTGSLQSNLVLTSFYALTHLTGRDEAEWMCQPELSTLKGRESEKGSIALSLIGVKSLLMSVKLMNHPQHVTPPSVSFFLQGRNGRDE